MIISNHTSDLTNFKAALIKALCKRGIKIFALAPNYENSTRDEVRALGAEPVDYPLRPTGNNPFLDVNAVMHLVKIIKKLQPDVVLSRAVKPVIYGSISARLAGVPRRIAMIEGLGFVFIQNTDEINVKRYILKYFVMWLYRIGLFCADRVVFLNPDDQKEFIENKLLLSRKSFLLGGIGVDLKKWQSKPPVIEPVTFLLVARLLREKGIEQYAQAARMIKQRHPKTRFILLGGIDENPGALKLKEINSWVDEGILEWHGHVSVQPWMEKSSVFVLPSYYREGVPASTQEAMATGRAIITTDAPGCRETVVDGENGFLIPVRNYKALAEKMNAFIEQPELIVRMGNASRLIAEERYDVNRVNEKLIALLQG
jgi:glycosyltransferase involved in cell wall biosynthesis